MSFDKVVEAADRCKSQIIETEIRTFGRVNRYLSTKYKRDCMVFFKCEDEQETGSFKFRGALNSILVNKNNISFFTHSSGNHGAALSRAAQIHGKSCVVVVPKGTPQSKIDNIVQNGGVVKECEANLKARCDMTDNLTKKFQGIYVSSFNQHNTIYGQGTVPLEILKSMKFLDILVVSISGGGLSAGISIVLDNLSPSTTMVIVSPKGKNLKEQFDAGNRHESTDFLNSAASGIQIKAIGTIPFDILRKVRNHMIFIEVDDDEMIDGCLQYWKSSGRKVEMSAGASIKATFDLLPSDLINQFSSFQRPIHISVIICGKNCERQISFE